MIFEQVWKVFSLATEKIAQWYSMDGMGGGETAVGRMQKWTSVDATKVCHVCGNSPLKQIKIDSDKMLQR